MNSLRVMIVMGALLGCAAPEPSDRSALEQAPTIARERWIAAAAGCEDADPSAELAACEGEPELGALLGESGVVCVDSLDALLLTRPPVPARLRVPEADPSPQPNVQVSRARPW